MSKKFINLSQMAELLSKGENANAEESQHSVKLSLKVGDTLVAIIDDVISGRLTLMVDGWKSLGAAKFDLLVDFCSAFTDREPVCRYEVDYGSGDDYSATIITWCKPEAEDGYLQVMINSNGFIRDGYEDLKLFGGRKAADYSDAGFKERLSGYASAMMQATA